ncbi:DUF2169 domain-containing protein [Massilia arenosa]|uniref:DUF2169 domain-containing protein n=1 Tax=Zemynaea arenosa TaxID=2561931 RepID=A0A4Y9SKK3_9BURK|nr:DUF2169 domain-containing protein [Massilia arenosa]TFW23396.1 DUF2169 domain-containing protein [Massilia arenosa]
MNAPDKSWLNASKLPNLVFDNRTKLAALHFLTLDQHHQLFHVFVARQSFKIGPRNVAGVAALIESRRHTPLVTEDRYFDGREGGSVSQESDLAPYKPKCDVIVIGSAHAPQGKPKSEFPVRLQVRVDGRTPIDKTLQVRGEARLERSSIVTRTAGLIVKAGTGGLAAPSPWRLSSSKPFVHVPIRYELAIGGECKISSDEPAAKRVPKKKQIKRAPNTSEKANYTVAHEVAETNPVGCGFAPDWYLDATGLSDLPAPRILYWNQDFGGADFWKASRGAPLPPPAGLGCVGRAWLPRRGLAGTFVDKAHWEPDEVPMLPKDFDYAYWNAAPADQQCELVRFGARFVLHNLCAHDHPSSASDAHGNSVLQFDLPQQAVFVLGTDGAALKAESLMIDTVIIDTASSTVDLVWRGCLDAEEGIKQVRMMRVSEPAQIERLDRFIAATAGSDEGGESHGQ